MLTRLRRWWTGSPSASPNPRLKTRLNLEAMEAREVPAAHTAVALPLYNRGSDSIVELASAQSGGAQIPLITPVPGYRGPLVAAAGDVNGDGVSDAIVGLEGISGAVFAYDGRTGG